LGMPARPAVESLASLPTEEIPHRPFRILMIGGSQGAQSLNRIVAEAFAKLSESGEFEILHQTGQLDYENVKHRYGSLPNIRAEPFLYDMEKHLAWADLLVCRSGASTVAEIAAAGRPAIFVPLPWAADDHQKKNAEVLVRSEAALMFEQRALSPELLVRAIKELFAQPETLRKMAKNVKQFHQPGAANRIALDLADWAT
ncbi:MAG: hypothetical protein N2578_04535, partial [Bdellovibrionaceae bacterium]|nr:hypothetical protein [Pseudobdellovibrionaceae bacterium]